MIVWVVTGQCGEYSSFDRWVVGVAHDLSEAHHIAARDRRREDGDKPYQATRSARKPANIEPGVTTVKLGITPDDWDSATYYAEAFNLPERA